MTVSIAVRMISSLSRLSPFDVLDTASGGADTAGQSVVRFGVSEARFRSGTMDRLLSMAVFKQVVEAGSFAAAARHFDISPEMAGNHVRGLEKHLGVRLLNRSTRRLHLTEAGEGYYARCKQILADVEEADAA